MFFSTYFFLQYNYLMEFDYLPKSDFETGALRTEEQFKDAIRNLQVTYNGIQKKFVFHKR